jgi:hypothetical protein
MTHRLNSVTEYFVQFYNGIGHVLTNSMEEEEGSFKISGMVEEKSPFKS